MKLFAAAVICPWAAGLAVFALIVRRWDAVKPSYYGTLSASASALVLILLMTSPTLPEVSGMHRTLWLVASGVAVGTCALAGLGFWFDRRLPARLSEIALYAGAASSSISAISAGAAQIPQGLGMARAASALLFLGSATATMVLGHWFLVDPQLDRAAIKRLGVIFVASIPIEVTALALSPGMIDVARLSSAGMAGYLRGFWVADAILTMLLGLGVLGALANRGYPAVMAATGLSYLAILTAFGVDVIAKALIGGSI